MSPLKICRMNDRTNVILYACETDSPRELVECAVRDGAIAPNAILHANDWSHIVLSSASVSCTSSTYATGITR